ncbi:hypothetical protein K9202_004392 [Salmonella enterica subsp. enterica serovar Infantis]|nr:hypothetical protein [Salmonella enterica subsp. enterica serovar Infantis]
MADFGSTKQTVTFEEWHELLMDYAELRGGNAADAEAWRGDYEAGKLRLKHIVMNGERINHD